MYGEIVTYILIMVDNKGGHETPQVINFENDNSKGIMNDMKNTPNISQTGNEFSYDLNNKYQ